jgi:hypothetical protein
VLNNAATAVLLRQSEHGIGELRDAFRLSEGECAYLVSCDRGHGLYVAGTERAGLAVIASDEEHVLCTSDPAELESLEARP